MALCTPEALDVPKLIAGGKKEREARAVSGSSGSTLMASEEYLRKMNNSAICGILIDDQAASAAEDVHAVVSIDAQLRTILMQGDGTQGAAMSSEGLWVMLWCAVILRNQGAIRIRRKTVCG